MDEKGRMVNLLKRITYQGKRVFKEVKLSSNVYSGPKTKEGPDIVWITNEYFSLNLTVNAKTLFNKRITNIKGDHISDKEGIYIFEGKYIKNKQDISIDLYDLYPIICRLLGIDAPDYIEGSINEDIIKVSKQKVLTLNKYVQKKISSEIAEVNYHG
jgi:predicted AlkP superfamily phosphohydrolase/phosphomutase